MNWCFIGEEYGRGTSDTNASKYANADKLYIILSMKQADMIKGVSIPYVGLMPDGNKIIFIFSSYKSAKEYVDKNGYERLDEIYPIGAIDKNDEYDNLEHICNLALSMGINRIDFDNVTTSEAFGCEIRWFMKSNHMMLGTTSMLLSENEFIDIANKNDERIHIHFNQIPIEEFQDPYLISEKCANEVLMHVFNSNDVDEFIFNFYSNESLIENCYVMDFMNTQMIPKAKQDGKQDDADYFSSVLTILSTVISKKVILTNNLYTLKDNKSNSIYTKNHSAYLIYTDRFKYMGPSEYIHLINIVNFLKFVTLNKIQNIVVTDGPHYIATIDAKLFFK